MAISIKTYLKIILFGLNSLICIESYAQMKPDEEFNHYLEKYPDETAIYLQKTEVVDYSVVNDSIVTTIKVYAELLQLGDNNIRHASHQVFSSTFSEVSELKAYSLIPGKRDYKRLDVIDFKESYDKDSYVFYDDTKEISFTYPAMQKGVKTVLEYTRTIKDPKLMGVFFFDTYAPIVKATYKILYDNDISVKPQLHNEKNLEIITSKKETTDRSEMTFVSSFVDKIKFDVRAPSYNHLASSIYSPVFHYIMSNGEMKEVISTPNNLHQWYRSFLKNLHKNDNELNQLVNTIITPQDSVLEKVKKIYYWVQSNIKYIAFEDGMRGLIPHEGNYVLNKRYGDCKDMASIIVSMLREANIKANYTWVGSRDIPYKYSATPSPITDNHMIATFSHLGVTYYLDATGQYTPIDLPTSMIQGKECLISLDDDSFIINEVPIIPKERNVMTDSVNITLDNGVVIGNGSVVLTGYAKVFNTYKLTNTNKKSTDDYVERLLGKGNNKFEINTYELHNISNLSAPINIDYKFNISDYYRQIGDNIYVNLQLDKTMTDALIQNRTVPVKSEYKYINRSIVKLEIPEGYRISDVPEDVSNNDENFGYKINYQSNDSEIIVEKEFYEDYLLLEPTDFDSWNELILEYAKACRKVIALEKIPVINEQTN